MWTESRGRLPTYLLVGGPGPNVDHVCKFFFFFFERVQDMLTWRKTDPGSCFQKTKDFWALTHVFRGSKVLDPGSCFQRPKIFGSWLMFSEDQGFWILAHVFRGLGFWGFGSCFQRTKGSGSWLMFSEA